MSSHNLPPNDPTTELSRAIAQLRAFAPALPLVMALARRPPSCVQHVNRAAAVAAVVPVLLFGCIATAVPWVGGPVCRCLGRVAVEVALPGVLVGAFVFGPRMLNRVPPVVAACCGLVAVYGVVAVVSGCIQPVVLNVAVFLFRQASALSMFAVLLLQFNVWFEAFRGGFAGVGWRLVGASLLAPVVVETAFSCEFVIWVFDPMPASLRVGQWVGRLFLLLTATKSLRCCCQTHLGDPHSGRRMVVAAMVLVELETLCVLRGLPGVWDVGASGWWLLVGGVQLGWMLAVVGQDVLVALMVYYSVGEAVYLCLHAFLPVLPDEISVTAEYVWFIKVLTVALFMLTVVLNSVFGWLGVALGLSRETLFAEFEL